MRDLAEPGTLLTAFQQRLSPEGLREVGRVAAETIARLKPAFSFVYLEATDAYGHLFGWMSPEYIEAVTFSDTLIGQIIGALEAGDDTGETIFVVMADHGGHDFGHGTDTDEDMSVPFVIAGPGVAQDVEIGEPVSIIDVAPTLLHLLGIDKPESWRGRSILAVPQTAR